MTDTFVRNGHVLHRNAGPDVLAMVPGGSEVHVLGGPTAVIWDLLAQPAAIEDLAAEMARLYERPLAEVGPPVEECVRTLTRRGLVEEGRD